MYKRLFIFQSAIYSVLVGVCFFFLILVTVSLGKTAPEPQYREYTLLSSETKTFYNGRNHVFSPICDVYVQETDKPLNIDSVVFRYADTDAIGMIPSGETITVGIQKEKSSEFEVSSLTYGDKTILSFKDYLKAHRRNKLLGIAALSVFSLIFSTYLVRSVICYIKKGYLIMFGRSKLDTEAAAQTKKGAKDREG